MASEKCCKKPKLTISNNNLFKCLQCRQYFTKAWKSFCFFCLQITVKKHTMVCKACNSYVHNTNDMTITLK